MLNAVTQGMKDDQRKSLTDIMNGASNDIKTASENFKNGTGTFSEFVDKFGKLQFKDFKEARTTILEGLNKVENDVPADKKAAFTAFKADIEKASSKDQLKDALNKHADIVALLDGDTVSK